MFYFQGMRLLMFQFSEFYFKPEALNAKPDSRGKDSCAKATEEGQQ